jgi:NADH-quinone oxidoreductase subunit L
MKVLYLPLVVLAVPSVLSGLVNTPWWNGLAAFLTTHTIEETLGAHHLPFDPGLAAISTVVALAGMWCAHQVYGVKTVPAERLGAMLGGWPYKILVNKYGMDYLYEFVIVKLALAQGVAGGLALFDTYVVDGAVNGAATATKALGGAVRRLQSGQLQGYGMAIVLGVLIITATMLIRG